MNKFQSKTLEKKKNVKFSTSKKQYGNYCSKTYNKKIHTRTEVKRIPKKSTNADQKTFILEEFLKTEEDYLENLHILRKYYIDFMKKEDSIVDQKIWKMFFSEFMVIIPINEMFIKELKEIKKKNKTEFSFSLEFYNCVITFSHCFKLYSAYIAKYAEITKKLHEERKENSRFRFFLFYVSKKLKKKKFRIVDFESYLVTPIQRIPRYKLLLQQIIKNMKQKKGRIREKEQKKLEEAYDTISKIADYCNNKRKEFRLNDRMKYLDGLLNIKDLIQSHRKLVLENNSPNMKSKLTFEKKDKKYRKCNIFIFSDLFVCLVIHKKAKPLQKKKIKLQTIAITLRDTTIVSKIKSDSTKFRLLSEENEDFQLNVKCENEKDRDSIVQALKKQISFMESSGIKKNKIELKKRRKHIKSISASDSFRFYEFPPEMNDQIN